MVDPISIMAGAISAEVAYKISQELAETDEKVAKEIEHGNIEKAISEADKTTIENIYTILTKLSKTEDGKINPENVKQFNDGAEKKYNNIEYVVA